MRQDSIGLVERYFRLVDETGFRNKYPVDIFVGNVEEAPPPNDSHFILHDDHRWTVSDWSRSEQQNWAVFFSMEEALNYSFRQLSEVPDFRQEARRRGFNPDRYDVQALVQALKIALDDKFPSEYSEIDETISKFRVENFALEFDGRDRNLNSKVFFQNNFYCEFYNTASSFCYVYWKLIFGNALLE